MNRRNFLEAVSTGSLAWAISERMGHSGGPTADRFNGPACGKFAADNQWRRVREAFLMSDEIVYFNTGGLGPTPSPVLDVVVNTMRQLQLRTNHGHNLIEEARPIVAEFVGCHPDELAFTRNATEGNSTIASGLKLQRGDQIILDSHAHQGGSLAWMTRQIHDGVNIRIFDPDPTSVQANLDRIAALVTPRTKVIQVSHVTAPTGIRMPVSQIGAMAHKHNIWFHIDGAQSVGMFPFKISDLNCDSFAACCHKWMCGPHGTGILFVRQSGLDEIVPSEVGSYAEAQWELPGKLVYSPSARRFECGTRDAATITGIVDSIRFLKSLGTERIAEHGLRLVRYLRNRMGAIRGIQVLSPDHSELQSAMVSFCVEECNCDEVFQVLSQAGIRCRPVRERGLNAVRVSVHMFNSQAECDQLINVLNEQFGRR